MPQSVKTLITLSSLTIGLLVAGIWGWKALTAPLPETGPPPVCVDTSVGAGEDVFRDQVVISVFNGSGGSGLAGATMTDLEDRGFVPAVTGNAPKKIPATEIWAADPKNPAVRLVRKQFKGAKVNTDSTQKEPLGPGVVVVIGEAFKGLRPDGPEKVTAKADATICSPPES